MNAHYTPFDVYTDFDFDEDSMMHLEVEDFIRDLADTGTVKNFEGTRLNMKKTVYYALATDWINDKNKIPGSTYVAFIEWAEQFVIDRKKDNF